MHISTLINLINCTASSWQLSRKTPTTKEQQLSNHPQHPSLMLMTFAWKSTTHCSTLVKYKYHVMVWQLSVSKLCKSSVLKGSVFLVLFFFTLLLWAACKPCRVQSQRVIRRLFDSLSAKGGNDVIEHQIGRIVLLRVVTGQRKPHML